MGYSKLVKNQEYSESETEKLNSICKEYALDKERLLININPKTNKNEKFNLKTGVLRRGITFDKKKTEPFKIHEGLGSLEGGYRGSGGFRVENEVFQMLKHDISVDLYHLPSVGIVFGRLCPDKMHSNLFKKIKDSIPKSKQGLLNGISTRSVENVRRPIIIKNNAIDFGNNTNRNIADLTLHFNDLQSYTAGILSISDEYISQKSTGLVTFINTGVKVKCFSPDDLKACSITKAMGALLLKTLGLNETAFCEVFNTYMCKNIDGIRLIAEKYNRCIDFTNNTPNTDFRDSLQKLIRKSMGRGNTIISHRIIKKDFVYKTKDKDIKLLSYNSYYGGKKQQSKRVDVEVKTDNMIFKFNIRSKQGGVYPTHLMCDFRYYG